MLEVNDVAPVKLEANGLFNELRTEFVGFDFKGREELRCWLGSLDCNKDDALRAPTVANELESKVGLGDEVTDDKVLGGLGL